MKHIKLFEEFEEFKKPTMFQKALKGAKQFFGIENKEDRKTIEKIYRTISAHPVTSGGYKIDYVKNIEEIKPGVIVAWLISGKTGNLTVDKNENTIIFDGKELQLKDLESECDRLYQSLVRFLPKPNYDIVKNTIRTRDIDPYEGLPPYERGDF